MATQSIRKLFADSFHSTTHPIDFNPAKSFIIYYVEVLALHSLDVPYKNLGYINCYM